LRRIISLLDALCALANAQWQLELGQLDVLEIEDSALDSRRGAIKQCLKKRNKCNTPLNKCNTPLYIKVNLVLLFIGVRGFQILKEITGN